MYLAGAFVIAGNFTAVNDIGIERIGSDIPVFLDADGMPFAEGDGAVIAAGGDAYGTTFLLTAINVVGKGIIGADVIKLGGGLVVPGREGLPSIDFQTTTSAV